MTTGTLRSPTMRQVANWQHGINCHGVVKLCMDIVARQTAWILCNDWSWNVPWLSLACSACVEQERTASELLPCTGSLPNYTAVTFPLPPCNLFLISRGGAQSMAMVGLTKKARAVKGTQRHSTACFAIRFGVQSLCRSAIANRRMLDSVWATTSWPAPWASLLSLDGRCRQCLVFCRRIG